MGGLVASQFLKNATNSQRSRTTLITLGTPFTGSPKAVNVFENGAMFSPLENLFVGGYIKTAAKNYPSAYQLLPTSRHAKYLVKSDVLQTYAKTTAFLKTRDWGITSSGRIKSQFSTASSFMSGLGSGTSHAAYLASQTYHIVASGEDTISKIHYVLDGGVYRTDYLQMSNTGDGTVLAPSARNGLAATNKKVFTYSGHGDHAGMLNDKTILKKVVSLITSARSTASTNGLPEAASSLQQTINDRGWLVGRDYDNRRIIINVNHSGTGQLFLLDGSIIQLNGETLFYTDSDGNPVKVGLLYETGVGYQYVLKNNSYLMNCTEISPDSNIIIRYLNNGYFDKISEYSTIPTNSISIVISNYDDMDTNAYDTSLSPVTATTPIIPIEKEYTPSELVSLNSQ